MFQIVLLRRCDLGTLSLLGLPQTSPTSINTELLVAFRYPFIIERSGEPKN